MIRSELGLGGNPRAEPAAVEEPHRSIESSAPFDRCQGSLDRLVGSAGQREDTSEGFSRFNIIGIRAQRGAQPRLLGAELRGVQSCDAAIEASDERPESSSYRQQRSGYERASDSRATANECRAGSGHSVSD